MDPSGRHDRVRGEDAVVPVAQRAPLRTQVVEAAGALAAAPAKGIGGLADDPLTWCVFCHTIPDIADNPGKLVADDNRRPHRDGDIAVVDVQVRPADAGGLDRDQHLACAGHRHGHIPDLQVSRAVIKFNKRFHQLSSCFSFWLQQVMIRRFRLPRSRRIHQTTGRSFFSAGQPGSPARPSPRR